MGANREIRTVLVVDDCELVLRAAKRGLERDYVVFVASDSRTAMEVARSIRPDIVFVDLRLGAESGVQLVTNLKAERQKLRVVCFSGFLWSGDVVAAMKAGADDVIPKAASLHEVLARLEAGTTQSAPRRQVMSVEEVEWEHLQRVMADHAGNKSGTAKALGMHRSVLLRKLKKHARRLSRSRRTT